MPAPGVVVGQRHTANVVDLKDREFEKKITVIEPDETPFITLLNQLKTVNTFAVKYEHAEIDYMEETVTVSGSQTDSEQYIELSTGHAARVPLNAQVMNKSTLELGRVIEVDTANDRIKIVRAAGGTTAAAMSNGDVLLIASEAQEEGVKFSGARTTKPSTDFNYVMDIETPIEMSWRQKTQKELTEPDWAFQVGMASVEHKKKEERAFIFGGRDSVTGLQGKPLTYTDGLFRYIKRGIVAGSTPSTNDKNMNNGFMSETSMEDWLESFMHFGRFDRKVLLMSPSAKLKLSRLAKGYVHTDRAEKILGVLVERLSILGHNIPIMTSRLLAKFYPKLILCIDLSAVRKRVFSNGSENFTVKWNKDIQDNDLKGKKDCLFCTEGFESMNFSAHGMYRDFGD